MAIPVVGITSRPSRSSSDSAASGSTRMPTPSATTSTTPGPSPRLSRSAWGMTRRPDLSMVVLMPESYHSCGSHLGACSLIPGVGATMAQGEQPAGWPSLPAPGRRKVPEHTGPTPGDRSVYHLFAIGRLGAGAAAWLPRPRDTSTMEIKPTSTRTVYENRWMGVREDQIERPGGSQGSRRRREGRLRADHPAIRAGEIKDAPTIATYALLLTTS